MGNLLSGFQKFADLAKKFKVFVERPLVRQAIYVVALLVLSVGFLMAVLALPDDLHIENSKYLWAVFCIGAPLGILMNTIETELSARLAGVRFGWTSALRVSVLSSAANTLPLPGGLLVRTAAINRLGVSMVKSGSIVTAVAIQWFGIVFLYSGVWLVVLGQVWFGALFLMTALLALLGSIYWMIRLECSFKQIWVIGALKLLASVIGILRVWWIYAAFSVFLSFGEVSVFTVVGVAGSAVSIVPAGLGVNEIAAALVAALVSIPPSLGFVVAALNRAIGLSFLLPLAAFFVIQRSKLRPW